MDLKITNSRNNKKLWFTLTKRVIKFRKYFRLTIFGLNNWSLNDG